MIFFIINVCRFEGREDAPDSQPDTVGWDTSKMNPKSDWFSPVAFLVRRARSLEREVVIIRAARKKAGISAFGFFVLGSCWPCSIISIIRIFPPIKDQKR